MVAVAHVGLFAVETKRTMFDRSPQDVPTVEASLHEVGEAHRGPLPRLTTRVFSDLAIWMTGLGLSMGVLFPFFVVALGVPSRYALTARFFVATIVAGLIVGMANQYLSRSVVGSRLRFMRSKMERVEMLLRESASGEGDKECTPESCSIRVDSDDELGAVLSSFNRLVAAQAASHRSNVLSSTFASILSSHLEVAPLLDEALAHLQDACGIEASALCINRDGTLTMAASNGIVDSECLSRNEVVCRAFRTLSTIEVDLPDDLLLEGGVVTFRPRQVMVVPLDIKKVPIGVLFLASAHPISRENRELIHRLAPGFAVALNNALGHERLQQVAAIDEMTGLCNRRSGLDRLRHALNSSRRTGEPLGVLLFDIDHFKSVNDRHGHQIGDEVINAVARSAKSALREGDTLMRYGGEEFLAVLPGAAEADIRELAERLRCVVESTVVAIDHAEISVTISLGAATRQSANVAGIDDLIRQADTAMYVSKNSGRNKLTFASD